MPRNRVQRQIPSNSDQKTPRSSRSQTTGELNDRETEALIRRVDALPEDDAWKLCQRIWQRLNGCRLDDILIRTQELAQERKYVADLFERLLKAAEEFQRLSAEDSRRTQRQRDEFKELANQLRARLALFVHRPKNRDAMFRALAELIDEKPDQKWQAWYNQMVHRFSAEMKGINSPESLSQIYRRWLKRQGADD